MTSVRCNNCKHYNKCPDAGSVWWVECPWWDGEELALKGKLEEYADKLIAGCCCENCSNICSEFCQDCRHLENWEGDFQTDSK